jgi:ATP phosphoribosyltransferase
MIMRDSKNLRVRMAIPSKGRLEQLTLSFLSAAGLGVFRPNERQYIASIPTVPEIEVLFQRAKDVLTKVDEGSVDFGITGYDVVQEHAQDSDNVIVMVKDLRFGRCELVVAVPERWLDVSAIGDLAEVAVSLKERDSEPRSLKIATQYPNLTRKWLYDKEIMYFSLVAAQGAIEAAPSMGYADIIVDVTSSGTTLRENRLKMISGGTILKSQACLIGNKKALCDDPRKLDTARTVIELIEAHLRARKYLTITANIRGESPEAIAASLSPGGELAGLHGPTISRVYSGRVQEDSTWYAVTIVVEEKVLMKAIDHVRASGGKDVTVSGLKYVFDSASSNYQELLQNLKAED